jgi:DNA-binding MarR family transcriptional regulator
MPKKSNQLADLIFTMNSLTKEGMEFGLNSLTFIQLQTLSFVYRSTNPTMKEIAQYLHITPPSATSIVNNLVKLKFLKRKTNGNDKRSTNLFLTNKGEKELHKGYDLAKKHLEKRLDYLSEKDKREFIRIISKLSHIFEQKN